MRNIIIKLLLSILAVILLVKICQKIQFTDTNTIDSDYWVEEEMVMAVQYLYYKTQH